MATTRCLLVSTVGGEVWEVNVEHAETVLDLKMKVAELMCTSGKARLQLVCGSKVLRNSLAVSELPESNLHAIVKARQVFAVTRVRPFNAKEKRLESETCVRMNDTVTTIADPCGNISVFRLDGGFWSHDGLGFDHDDRRVASTAGSCYASQKCIFDDIGQQLLEHAFAGVEHCSMLAFGQAGAGKTYSMVGFDEDKGIVPLFAEGLFRRITQTESDVCNYLIKCSVFDIYGEVVNDLLGAEKGLKVRQGKDVGVFVDGLTWCTLVSSAHFDEVLADVRNRRLLPMIETTQRHTLIEFQLERVEQDGKVISTSKILFGDLAGSERVMLRGSRADLAERARYCKSLMALGTVLRCLNTSRFVPYRDSKLTWLLSNSFRTGGTLFLLGCLSPSATNYDESLHTLRFLARAMDVETHRLEKSSSQREPVSSLDADRSALPAECAMHAPSVEDAHLSIAKQGQDDEEDEKDHEIHA
eukprot:TRINITY_DN13091_c0_g1_i4.p1 TRINITY_DN13091_c0_g1~~TRINITY_DN13091_c0_g1_i4.p1  ORF type:complete len:490 (-),score=57.08 TRINITY_DN13091_c0_g1_i4:13-1428(-)